MKQISQISKRILIDSLKIKIRKRKCANKKLQISLKSVRINQTWASPVNVTVSSLNSSTAKNGIYLHFKMERFEKKKKKKFLSAFSGKINEHLVFLFQHSDESLFPQVPSSFQGFVSFLTFHRNHIVLARSSRPRCRSIQDASSLATVIKFLNSIRCANFIIQPW